MLTLVASSTYPLAAVRDKGADRKLSNSRAVYRIAHEDRSAAGVVAAPATMTTLPA
jgi:hypothetical protein